MNEEALAHWGWGGAVAPGGETKEEELWYEALYSVRGCRKIYCYERSHGVSARPVKGRALDKEKQRKTTFLSKHPTPTPNKKYTPEISLRSSKFPTLRSLPLVTTVLVRIKVSTKYWLDTHGPQYWEKNLS